MDDLRDLLAWCLPADEPPMRALDLTAARKARRLGSILRTTGVLAALVLIGLPVTLVASAAMAPITGVAMLPGQTESPQETSARLTNAWRDAVPGGIDLLYIGADRRTGSELVDGGVEFDGNFAYNSSRVSPLLSYAVGRPASDSSAIQCGSGGYTVNQCSVGRGPAGTVVSFEEVHFTTMAYVVRTVTLWRTDGVRVSADLSVPGDRFASARFPLTVVELTDAVADPRFTFAPIQSIVDTPAAASRRAADPDPPPLRGSRAPEALRGEPSASTSAPAMQGGARPYS
jgi:hypothetical protein